MKKEHESIRDATDCNQKLLWAQKALYINNTDFSIDEHLKCFEEFKISTDLLRCQLTHYKFQGFVYWLDLPVVQYVSISQNNFGDMSNEKCMGEFANSYYNKYLTLNAPDPHKWMAEK